MIELTFSVDDEIAAFDLLTYARGRGLTVSGAKKDGEIIEIQEGGFLKKKPVARRLPVGAQKLAPSITNLHI